MPDRQYVVLSLCLSILYCTINLLDATAFFRPVNFPFFCNLYQYIVGTSSAPCLSKWHLSNMRFSSSSTNIYRGLHAERTSSQKESISISTWFRSHLDRDVLHNLYARRLISVPIAFRPSLLASMMVVPEPNIGSYTHPLSGQNV